MGVYSRPDGQARLPSQRGKPQGGAGTLPAPGPGGGSTHPKGKRGRPWRYDHGLYLALLLFRAFFHLTYRKTEALLQDFMEAPFPSHQSLARYAAQHLDLKLLEALLERLSRELEAHPHSAPPSLQEVISPRPQQAHRGLVTGGPG
jgi:hypothetical protein